MYHYTESGLDNVWLENGYIQRGTSYGLVTAVQDVDGLYKVIGRTLAHKGHLTGAEFRFLRKRLGLSQARFAALIGKTEQAVALWERKGNVPETDSRMLCAIYLETMDGNLGLKQYLERIAELDRKESERLVFHDTATGWVPLAA
ncbi:helix-turn-helix domain-containing protein [Trinickia sp.]|uniref:helix-turn-helix domain-containing protein n=1 Tax=Trinickia sp. TaxID=2571163 RepID=UPI003F7E43C5